MGRLSSIYCYILIAISFLIKLAHSDENFEDETNTAAHPHTQNDDVTENELPVESRLKDSIPGWLDSLLIWAAREPLSFLYYVLLGLSPLFLLSAILSWKLCKDIEKKEQKRRKKIKKKE